MVADTGPIGGNLSHEFIILADTGESESIATSDYLDFEVPGEDVNFDDVASLQAIVDRWTSLYAATSEKHGRGAFAKLPADKQVSARGIEVGHIFYFGTNNSAPMKAVVAGPDGAEHPSIWAPTARPEPPGPASSRSRRRHQVARGGDAVQGWRSSNLKRALPTNRWRPAKRLSCAPRQRRRTCSTTISTSGRAPNSPPPT